MGQQTVYCLRIVDADKTEYAAACKECGATVMRSLSDVAIDWVKDNPLLAEHLGDCIADLFNNSVMMSWYTHESDVRCISMRFSHAIFILDGEGADYGNKWRKYFKAGKMQLAETRIEFDEYDPKKLD